MDKVDWDGLKALEAKSSASFFPQDHINLHSAILGAWPQILAEHEKDQRVIAAAEKQIELLKTHPCLLEDGDFDHDWKFVDESFDHEFGTEVVHYYECKHCNATKDAGGEDDEG